MRHQIKSAAARRLRLARGKLPKTAAVKATVDCTTVGKFEDPSRQVSDCSNSIGYESDMAFSLASPSNDMAAASADIACLARPNRPDTLKTPHKAATAGPKTLKFG